MLTDGFISTIILYGPIHLRQRSFLSCVRSPAPKFICEDMQSVYLTHETLIKGLYSLGRIDAYSQKCANDKYNLKFA